jgi:hypothetical protein
MIPHSMPHRWLWSDAHLKPRARIARGDERPPAGEGA